jgi:hypothetical protein
MYFNFEDYRPDTPTLPRSLTRLEASLLTVVIYLSFVIVLLVWPNLPFVKAWEAERLQRLEKQQEEALQRQRENPRFVFVAPRVDRQAPKPPQRAELSDIDRKARTTERAEKPTNSMPFARGNTSERIEGAPRVPEQRAAEPPQPEAKSEEQRQPLPDSPNATLPRPPEVAQTQPRGSPSGVLADAIKNVQKYAPRDSYVNLKGGADQAQLVHPRSGDVPEGTRVGHVLRREGRADHRAEGVAAIGCRRVQQLVIQRARRLEPHRAASTRVSGRSRVLHGHLLLQRKPGMMSLPTRSQQIGLLLMLAVLVVLALVRAFASR